MANTSGIRAGRVFVELGVNDKLQAGLKRAQAQLRAFGAGVREIGGSLLGMGAAIGAPAVLATKTFATFEQSMARVKALTEANADEFAKLEGAARDLGKSTVFSASQAANAMSSFAQAGFKVEEILGAIGPALDLAAAGQLDMATAAGITANIMKGMGLSATELGVTVDLLTKAMTTANTDLVQLGDAMKYVGPVAKTAGIALEEVTASVQILSNAGIQGQMAGTTLRGAIQALTGPSAEAATTLKKLGVAVNDSAGDMRPLADIIEDFEKSLAGMGSGQKLEIIGKVFDARAASGFAEMISQGAGQLRDFTAALQNSGGTAKRVADTQINTLSGSFEVLKSGAEEVGIGVGAAIAAPLRAVVESIAAVTDKIGTWVSANQAIVTSVVKAAAGVTAVGGAMVGLGIAAGPVITALKVVGLAAGALASPFTLIVGGLAAVGVAMASTQVAGTTFGDALSSVAVAISDAWGKLTEFLQPVLSAMQAAFETVFSAIYAAVVPATETAASTVSAAWVAVKSVVGPVLGWLRDATVTAFAAAAFAVVNWKKTLELSAKSVGLGVVRFANQVEYFLGEVVPQYLNYLADNWKNIFTTMWNFTKTVTSNVWTNLTNFASALASWLSGGEFNFEWTGLLDGFESTMTKLPEVAARVMGPLEASMQQEVDRLSAAMVADFNEFRKGFDAKMEGGAAPAGVDAGQAGVTADKAAGAFDAMADVAKAATQTKAKLEAAVAGVAETKGFTTGSFSGQNTFGYGAGGRQEELLERIARSNDKIARNQVAFT